MVAAGATAATIAAVGVWLWTSPADEGSLDGADDSSVVGTDDTVRTDDDVASGTSPAGGDTAASSRQAEETAAPTAVAGIAPSMDPSDVTDDQPADELAEPLVDIRSDALSSPEDADQDMLVTVSEGLARDALESTVAEYRERGWTQIGRPTVVSTKVTAADPDADPPSAELDVCLDYSNVDVVDTAGTSVVDARAQTRVLNVFEMEYQDGRWVLVNQTFADDITC